MVHNGDYRTFLREKKRASQRPSSANSRVGTWLERLAQFGDRVIRESFQDYLNLQRLVGSVEFSLAPLQRNVFTDCKSPLKVFEASAVGTLSIASPSRNYAVVLRDGENGHLARAHEWERKIRQAIDELPRYGAMAERARDEAVRHFGWQAQRTAIERALGWG